MNVVEEIAVRQMARQARNLRVKLSNVRELMRRGQLVGAATLLEETIADVDAALERAKEFGVVV